jgi:hypothetical protein
MERMDWFNLCRKVGIAADPISGVLALQNPDVEVGFDRLVSRVARSALLQSMPWLRIWAAGMSLGILGRPRHWIRFEMAFAESKAAKGQKALGLPDIDVRTLRPHREANTMSPSTMLQQACLRGGRGSPAQRRAAARQGCFPK